MRTHPKSKTKIGSRKLYLDVNPEVYVFITQLIGAINSGQKTDVDSKWKQQLKSHKEFYIGRKPIYSVFCKLDRYNARTQIQYTVNWDLLLRSLETLSKGMISDLKKNPNIGLGILYNLLARNYIKLTSIASPLHIFRDISKQKLGMRQTGDWTLIRESIKRISDLIYKIEVKFPTDSFFELSDRLYRYATDLDFNGLYYTLRELLDRLFPVLFVHAVIRKERLDLKLAPTFFSLYLNYMLKELWGNKGNARRGRHIEKLTEFERISQEFVDKVKNRNLINGDGSPNFANWDKAFNDRNFSLPLISADAKGLSVLTEVLSAGPKNNGGLKRLYEVCSSSVHNTLSLPAKFFLEVKVAKHFLNWYKSEVGNILDASKVLDTSQMQTTRSISPQYSSNLSKLVNFCDSHETTISKVIDKFVLKEKWDFEAIKSFYRVYQPGVSRLRKGEINYLDFREAIQETMRVCYGTGVWSTETRLEDVGKSLMNEFNDKSDLELLSKFLPSETGFVCTYMYFEYYHHVVDDQKEST